MLYRFFITAVFVLFVSSAFADDFSYENIKLGSNIKTIPKDDYKCAPAASVPGEKQCNKNQAGSFMGFPAKKVELGFKKSRLHIIFIGLDPSDVASAKKTLIKKYGRPIKDKELLSGVYQTTWQKGDTELVLNKTDKRGTADITIIDFRKR